MTPPPRRGPSRKRFLPPPAPNRSGRRRARPAPLRSRACSPWLRPAAGSHGPLLSPRVHCRPPRARSHLAANAAGNRRRAPSCRRAAVRQWIEGWRRQRSGSAAPGWTRPSRPARSSRRPRATAPRSARAPRPACPSGSPSADPAPRRTARRGRGSPRRSGRASPTTGSCNRRAPSRPAATPSPRSGARWRRTRGESPGGAGATRRPAARPPPADPGARSHDTWRPVASRQPPSDSSNSVAPMPSAAARTRTRVCPRLTAASSASIDVHRRLRSSDIPRMTTLRSQAGAPDRREGCDASASVRDGPVEGRRWDSSGRLPYSASYSATQKLN